MSRPKRFQGKYLFLTFSKCPLDKDHILSTLLTIKPTNKIIVCNELHQDGTKHAHVGIELSTRLNTTNSRLFDIDGYHPKIETAKCWAACIRYAKKEEDFCFWPETMSEEDLEAYDGQGEDELPDPKEFDNEADYLRECYRQKVPAGYATRMWQISMRRDQLDITDETLYGEIIEDLAAMKIQSFNTVLLGPTGIGKTSWAIKNCTKPALWVRHMDDLKYFKQKFHKSIIFDDMNFQHLPRTAQIHLVDYNMPSSIHVRYGTVLLPPKLEKIFTSNEPIFENDSAINRRFKLIDMRL